MKTIKRKTVLNTSSDIKDKFVIKETGTCTIITEDTLTRSIIRYPALFNSEDDALEYLKIKNVSEDNFYIQNTNKCYINHAVLVELEDENKNNQFSDTVEEVLKQLDEVDRRYKHRPLIIEIVPIGDSIEFRISHCVNDIFIDEENKCVTLSNYVDGVSYDHTIPKIIDELNNYKDYKIKVKVYDNTRNVIYDDYILAPYTSIDNSTNCVKLFTAKTGEFKF